MEENESYREQRYQLQKLASEVEARVLDQLIYLKDKHDSELGRKASRLRWMVLFLLIVLGFLGSFSLMWMNQLSRDVRQVELRLQAVDDRVLQLERELGRIKREPDKTNWEKQGKLDP